MIPRLLSVLRILLSVLLVVLAIPFTIVVIGPFLSLPNEAELNRDLMDDFRVASKLVSDFSSNKGRLPDYEEVKSLAQGTSIENFAINLYVDKIRCGLDGARPQFAKADRDEFVLSYWRGESFDCYAVPSEKNTLRVRTKDLVDGYEILYSMGSALVIVVLSSLAWISWPYRRRTRTANV